MSQLFKCESIAQFKIMSWLAVQGLTAEDIARVDMLAADRLKITNPAGQYMVIRWANGHAEIEGGE